MKVQIKKIEIDKWCAGHGLQKDPGDEYVIEWISRNAGWFRQSWEQSCCKSCQSSEECGHHMVKDCGKYNSNDY